MQIRSYIKSFCNSDRIINVYIPQIPGKERRKAVPSKQGFLGVEGIDRDTVISALQRSGVNLAATKVKTKISKTDLYVAGLSGKKDSRRAREDFLRFISLPVGMSANAFLDALNALYSVDEFNSEVEKWRQAQV